MKSVRFMKPIKLIAAATMIIASGTANAYEYTYAGSASGCSIILFGDSILHGAPNIYTRYFNNPGDVLRRDFGFPVEDYSSPGRQLKEYGDYVRQYGYPQNNNKIVVLQAGTNDAGWADPSVYNPYTSQSRIRNDYSFLIDSIRASGQIPVLTGITNISPTARTDAIPPEEATRRLKEIQAIMRDVAHQKAVHYVGFDSVPLNWEGDGLHLTEESTKQLAYHLGYKLREICILN